MTNNGRSVFPLTSLQIGDLQSYLSHLTLFLAFESGKFYILVDNRPWLEDLASRSTHIWQLMVTKWRLSPFANTRWKREKKTESHNSSSVNGNEETNFKKWFYLIDSVIWSSNMALLPVKSLTNSLTVNSKLHRTLYGFIVFEVAWADVRGINYFNELQTDTSLIIESKYMRRWEFDSIDQAVKCVYAWFPGTSKERFILEDHLIATSGEVFYDTPDSFPSTTEVHIDRTNSHEICPDEESATNIFGVYSRVVSNGINTPSNIGPYKRRKVTSSTYDNVELRNSLREEDSEIVEVCSQNSNENGCEEPIEAAFYKDVLISFRFDDCDLPFKLKDIIMSELHLLTLLEAGLPSWVIFFQSYPLIYHLYRPWMCPLTRAVYVLISIITVLIGFYDLYKNVPLLKATASHLFGPFFDWIETWEMISRIKYLGTMLFLHNVQKAIKWFFTLTRITRSFLSFFIVPISRPFIEFLELFLPLWGVCIHLVSSVFSLTWTVLESFFTVVGDLVEILLMPLWFVSLILGNFVTSFVYPILWILSEIMGSLFRLVLGLSSFVVSFCTYIYASLVNLRAFASGLFHFTRSVESTVTSYEVSMWRSLWNDLFSQVFRALRVILNGFVAFAIACNRHRLSIYNHMMEFAQRLSYSTIAARGAENNAIVQISEHKSTPTPMDESRNKTKPA